MQYEYICCAVLKINLSPPRVWACFLAAVSLSGSSQNHGKLKKFRGIVKTSAEERGAMHSLTMSEGVLEELINMLDGKNLHCVCIMLHVFGLSNILIDT